MNQRSSSSRYLQVIVAFIAAASLSIIFTILCLLLSRRAEGDAQHPDYKIYAHLSASNPDILREPPEHFNVIDRYARKWFCGPAQNLVRRLHGNPAILADCFYDGVIAFGDQQIVTGIAIMISAMKRMSDRDSPLSTYHLVIVGDLVWFSSNAHLLALNIIRSYDDSAKPGTPEREDRARRITSSKVTRGLRAVLMATLAGTLLWASVLTGDVYTYDRFQCPAACLYTSVDGKGGDPKKWMIVNCFYVVYNYTPALFMLWRRFRRWWMDLVSLRIHPGNGHPRELGWMSRLQERWRLVDSTLKSTTVGRMVSRSPTWAIISLCVSLAQRALFSLVWAFVSSEVVGVIEMITWFGLGIRWAMEDRDVGHGLMDAEQRKTEDSWGFGQLVPLIFLFLPFMQFTESYANYRYDEAREEELRGRQPGTKGA